MAVQQQNVFKGEVPQTNAPKHPPSAMSNIIDIRSDAAGVELKRLILDGLNIGDDEGKILPTMLLYDEQGLGLFEDITYLDEYYLTGSEITLLEKYADDIASRIPNGSMIMELGSGNLRKIKLLLEALDRREKNVSYYALDLMQAELKRTLAVVPHGTFKHIQCYGLWGTYDDGLEWLKRTENKTRHKVILSMGSSIGNFARDDAASFLRNFASALQPTDTFLIGIDACLDPDIVFHAYNDRQGLTHRFVMNGLVHANRLLGKEEFEIDNWQVIGEYDDIGGRHRAFVSPKTDVIVCGVSIRAGERVRIEESYKYSAAHTSQLWVGASFIELGSWTDDAKTYGLHLVKRQN